MGPFRRTLHQETLRATLSSMLVSRVMPRKCNYAYAALPPVSSIEDHQKYREYAGYLDNRSSRAVWHSDVVRLTACSWSTVSELYSILYRRTSVNLRARRSSGFSISQQAVLETPSSCHRRRHITAYRPSLGNVSRACALFTLPSTKLSTPGSVVAPSVVSLLRQRFVPVILRYVHS